MHPAGDVSVDQGVGVVIAHDRAVATIPKHLVAPSQYPLLGVMVTFTVGGLFLLFGG